MAEADGEALSGLIAWFNPHRIDIRQGNLVTPEMVAQLKPGLSREQVRFILGAPLLQDPFHANRWDYVYRFKAGRGELVQQRLAVLFEDGKLARLEGDVAQLTATAAGPSAPRQIEIKAAVPAVEPASGGPAEPAGDASGQPVGR